MKTISFNLDFKLNPSVFSSDHLLTTSEQQILDLQELFLNNGIHYITVANIKEGRSLIYLFLNALRCFSAAGCITTARVRLKKETLDVYQQLKQTLDLDAFFIHEFNCDFLWVELDNSKKIYSYITKIEELGIDKTLPIVILTLN